MYTIEKKIQMEDYAKGLIGGKKKNPKWLLEYEHRRIISQNGLTRE